MSESCALDVADEGGMSLGQLGRVLGKATSTLQRIEERAQNEFRARWVA